MATGFPGGEIDRRWADPNPRPSGPSATTFSVWPPPVVWLQFTEMSVPKKGKARLADHLIRFHSVSRTNFSLANLMNAVTHKALVINVKRNR